MEWGLDFQGLLDNACTYLHIVKYCTALVVDQMFEQIITQGWRYTEESMETYKMICRGVCNSPTVYPMISVRVKVVNCIKHRIRVLYVHINELRRRAEWYYITLHNKLNYSHQSPSFMSSKSSQPSYREMPTQKSPIHTSQPH